MRKLLGKEMDYSSKNNINNFSQSEQHTYLVRALIISAYVTIFWILLPAFLFVTGLRLDLLLPIKLNCLFICNFIGKAFVMSGFVLMLTSIVQLKYQGRGLPISHLPPKKFVEKGMYKIFRHPIYAGYTIAFVGISILIRSFWSMSFSASILSLGWIGYSLFYEEPILIRRFGSEYSEYKKKVPLLLPYKISKYFSRKLFPVKVKLYNLFSRIAATTILYQRGNFILATYGLYFTLAGIIMMQLMLMFLLNQNLSVVECNIFICGEMASLLIFSRLFWWFGHYREFSSQKYGAIKYTGLVSWEGLTGVLINALMFSYLFNYPFLVLTDSILISGFLAYSIGRVGCVSYGCCYGSITREIGILYTSSDSKAVREKGLSNAYRYPTQLYSIFLGLFVFIIINLLTFLSPPQGFITAFALMLYGLLRAFIEFFRDRKRLFRGIFSEGHVGCLIVFTLGWLTLFLISPGEVLYTPTIFSIKSFYESIQSLPVIFILGVFCFFFTATHWKKLGNW